MIVFGSRLKQLVVLDIPEGKQVIVIERSRKATEVFIDLGGEAGYLRAWDLRNLHILNRDGVLSPIDMHILLKLAPDKMLDRVYRRQGAEVVGGCLNVGYLLNLLRKMEHKFRKGAVVDGGDSPAEVNANVTQRMDDYISCHPNQNTYVFAIEGCVGSGKSTQMEILCAAGLLTFREPLGRWEGVLRWMYACMGERVLSFQLSGAFSNRI